MALDTVRRNRRLPKRCGTAPGAVAGTAAGAEDLRTAIVGGVVFSYQLEPAAGCPVGDFYCALYCRVDLALEITGHVARTVRAHWIPRCVGPSTADAIADRSRFAESSVSLPAFGGIL